MFLKCKF